MTQELTRRPQTRYSVMPTAARFNYAQTLAGASDMIPRGLFDKATGRPSPAKIFLVLEIGATLGLEPSAAMQGIDVIEGKAAISPQLMTGLIRAAGHKLRILEEGAIEDGDYKVTVTLIRSDDPDYPIDGSWTPKQAARAGLCTYAVEEDGDWHVRARAKDDPSQIKPWEQYTEDMCLWRAMGRLGRRGGNDILMGIAYMPEELAPNVELGEDGMRDFTVQNEAEARLLAELVEIDDKQDLREFYQRVNSRDEWTARISSEFDAQFMRTKSDRGAGSLPAGAPGKTGDPDLDGPPAPTNGADDTAPDLTEDHGATEHDETPVDTPVAKPKREPKPFNSAAMGAPVAEADPDAEWVDPDIAAHEAEIAAQEDTVEHE